MLAFEYYRVAPDGSRQKLSVGIQEVAWVRRDGDGLPIAEPWPAEVRSALLNEASHVLATHNVRSDSTLVAS